MYPLYIIYNIERENIKTLFLKNLLIEIQGPRCWTVWGKKLSGVEWSGAEWSHGVE